MLLDATIAALGGLMSLREPIQPQPAGGPIIRLPLLIQAKLMLYEAMRIKGINNCEMGRILGIHENAVRRLLDLDHRSHVETIERGLAALLVTINLEC